MKPEVTSLTFTVFILSIRTVSHRIANPGFLNSCIAIVAVYHSCLIEEKSRKKIINEQANPSERQNPLYGMATIKQGCLE